MFESTVCYCSYGPAYLHDGIVTAEENEEEEEEDEQQDDDDGGREEHSFCFIQQR